jgi:hypothetical protein
MIHDLKKRGVQDATRINDLDYLEFQYWASRFKITTKVLREAVEAIGPIINNVREFLNKKGYIIAS